MDKYGSGLQSYLNKSSQHLKQYHLCWFRVNSVLNEINESVKTGLWVGDCFIYTNSLNRLNYYVGGEICTISHLDRQMYLLGYIPNDNRIYLGDKELNIVSFSLLLSVLEYQTAVMRKDF